MVITVGVIVSLLTRKSYFKKNDTHLMLPFFRTFFPFLPQRLIKHLECGYNYEVKKNRNKKKHFFKRNDTMTTTTSVIPLLSDTEQL